MSRLRAAFGTVAAAVLVPLATVSSASAGTINGCDVHADNTSSACMVFNTDRWPWLNPEVELTWPSGPFRVGDSVTVTATGSDLLRPVSIQIERTTDDAEDVAVGSLTVGPGALSASASLVLDTPGLVDYAAFADDGDAGLWVSDGFEALVEALPSSLTSDLPSSRTVKVNSKADSVTGTVSGGARPVTLQVRARDGSWVSVASTTSSANGSYAVNVPTYWVGKHTFRAYAPPFGTFGAAEGTKSGDVTVKRTYKPKGSNAHLLMFGHTARYNACTPIRYAVNTSQMPRWAKGEIRFALREVSSATGLRFAAAGTTNHVPFARKENAYPTNIDLVFAFSDPKTVPGLIGSTMGLGGASSSGNVIFDGRVTLDVTQKASHDVWREIVLHEVGHAMGLGHVGDRRQVMRSGARGITRYQKGDLVGLAALGAGAGACTGVPDAYYRSTARAVHDLLPASDRTRRLALP